MLLVGTVLGDIRRVEGCNFCGMDRLRLINVFLFFLELSRPVWRQLKQSLGRVHGLLHFLVAISHL